MCCRQLSVIFAGFSENETTYPLNILEKDYR